MPNLILITLGASAEHTHHMVAVLLDDPGSNPTECWLLFYHFLYFMAAHKLDTI